MKQVLFLAIALTAAVFAGDSITVGTAIEIRTNEVIKEEAHTAKGRVYSGVVTNDVTDHNGKIVIPHGANAELIARRVGKDELAIDLNSVSVGEHRYPVSTSEQDTKQKAGIGAVAGAATGVGTQLVTRGRSINVPSESVLTFRLKQPLNVNVR